MCTAGRQPSASALNAAHQATGSHQCPRFGGYGALSFPAVLRRAAERDHLAERPEKSQVAVVKSPFSPNTRSAHVVAMLHTG